MHDSTGKINGTFETYPQSGILKFEGHHREAHYTLLEISKLPGLKIFAWGSAVQAK